LALFSGHGSFDPWSVSSWIDLSSLPLRPDSQVLGSLTWLASTQALEGLHNGFVDRQPDEDSKAFALNCLTAFWHEARHYHDYVVTPYGCAQFRSSIAMALGGSLLATGALAARSIYVPIHEWVANYPLLKQVFPALDPPPALFVEGHALFDEMLGDSLHLSFPADELPSSVDARSIVEGSAILVQEGLIERVFGQSAARCFMDQLRRSPASRNYLGAVDFLRQGPGREAASRNRLRLQLLASLCGRFDRHYNSMSFPSAILMRLYLASCGSYGESDDQHLALVQDQMLKSHGGTIEQMLGTSDVLNRAFLNVVDAVVEQWESTLGTSDRLFAHAVQDYFRQFCELHRSLVSRISGHIAWYCSDEYAIQSRSLLPQPLLYLFAAGGLPISEQQGEHFVIESAARQGDCGSGRLIPQVVSPKIYEDEPIYKAMREHVKVLNIVRFLVNGVEYQSLPAGGRRESLRDQDAAALFNLAGTDIYTLNGKLDSFVYPEDLSQSDPQVVASLLALRGMKSQAGAPEFRDGALRQCLSLVDFLQPNWRRRKPAWAD
jgi:hypothetical protein